MEPGAEEPGGFHSSWSFSILSLPLSLSLSPSLLPFHPLPSVCVCACVSLSMYLNMCACRRQRPTLGDIPRALSTLIFEEVLPGLKLTKAHLAYQRAPGLSPAPQDWCSDALLHLRVFIGLVCFGLMWVLGDQTRVLTLVEST